MTARPIPRRYWRRHGTGPLPSSVEALDEPFNAFPSWFLRITCDRCGKVQDGQRGEARLKRSDMLIRDIIDRMRHDRMRRQGWCGWSRSGSTSRQAVDAIGND
jgi:hypothetical protein